MEIKQEGLKININNFTGKMILTYYFPIKNEFSPKFEEVASTYNCKIETIRRTTFVIFEAEGDSISCFEAFRNVQRELMIYSRKLKIESLESQISRLTTSKGKVSLDFNFTNKTPLYLPQPSSISSFLNSI